MVGIKTTDLKDRQGISNTRTLPVASTRQSSSTPLKNDACVNSGMPSVYQVFSENGDPRLCIVENFSSIRYSCKETFPNCGKVRIDRDANLATNRFCHSYRNKTCLLIYCNDVLAARDIRDATCWTIREETGLEREQPQANLVRTVNNEECLLLPYDLQSAEYVALGSGGQIQTTLLPTEFASRAVS